MTGDDVTECVGGEVSGITDDDLSKNYKSHCDPRLNGQQALEIAFLIAARMRRSEVCACAGREAAAVAEGRGGGAEVVRRAPPR